MIREEDIAELIAEELKKEKDQSEEKWRKIVAADSEPKYGFFSKERMYIRPQTTLPKGRFLLTEYDLRKMIADGRKEIKIPKNSIISPLALEILQAKGIEVVYE